jgi:hypothetical protein
LSPPACSRSSTARASASRSSNTCHELRRLDLVRLLEHRPQQVVAQVDLEDPQRRGHARRRRHHDGRDAEVLGDRHRVQRAGAAAGHERELARIPTALYRDQVGGGGHARVGDAQDAAGGLGLGEAQLPGQPRDGLFGELGMDLEVSAKVRGGLQPAEIQVRVGDRRLVVAPVQAGRARVGAALCGPTRSEPPASTHAIVPPPAPIATRSTAGNRIGMFQSTRHSEAIDGRPSYTSDRSALVPPMSNVITLGMPADLPTRAPPTTPPAGPE